jgi:membrane associated rhomboid family serine protease
MIPIRDHNPSGGTPFVTYSLIAVNILVFLYMLFLPENLLDGFINTYALIPAQITSGKHLETFVTSMFIHGSIVHIAGNMLFLNIFGDNLENRLGRIKYLFFYFLCGFFASLAQIIVDPTSTIPQIGASGAIAGLMGGYLVLYPNNPIDILFSIGPFLKGGTVPAWAMLIYWFIFQLFYGVGSLASTQDIGGVAYFAHIGGFAAGFGIISIFEKRQGGNAYD